MSYVAANLRALRRARGLTQERYAERVDIDVRHLSDLENAKRTPSFRLLVALADGLGVQVVDLFVARKLARPVKGRPKTVVQHKRGRRKKPILATTRQQSRSKVRR